MESYKLKIEQIYEELNSSFEGLNNKEALKRLENGKNVLPKKKRDRFSL